MNMIQMVYDVGRPPGTLLGYWLPLYLNTKYLLTIYLYLTFNSDPNANSNLLI